MDSAIPLQRMRSGHGAVCITGTDRDWGIAFVRAKRALKRPGSIMPLCADCDTSSRGNTAPSMPRSRRSGA